tara:strand:- start:208 stop:348 length:141 start_codon:yes stop_codon:yes gene_type:complete
MKTITYFGSCFLIRSVGHSLLGEEGKVKADLRILAYWGRVNIVDGV